MLTDSLNLEVTVLKYLSAYSTMCFFLLNTNNQLLIAMRLSPGFAAQNIYGVRNGVAYHGL